MLKDDVAYFRTVNAMQTRNDLLEAALRALANWTQGQSPKPADIEIIYRSSPGSTHIPFDELCCEVIRSVTAGMDTQGAHNGKQTLAPLGQRVSPS